MPPKKKQRTKTLAADRRGRSAGPSMSSWHRRGHGGWDGAGERAWGEGDEWRAGGTWWSRSGWEEDAGGGGWPAAGEAEATSSSSRPAGDRTAAEPERRRDGGAPQAGPA